MATTAYVQLKNPRIVRTITATSSDLTWVFGRRTTATVLYQSAATSTSTAAQTKKLTTLIHEVEHVTGGTTPVTEETSISAFNGLDATSLGATSGNITMNQTAQYVTKYMVPSLDANMEVLNVEVFDYVRFTGTGLPTAGLYFDINDVAGIFNVAPSATDSL